MVNKYENVNLVATNLKLSDYVARFRTTRWGVFNADKPIDYPSPFVNPIELIADNYSADDIEAAYVFDMKKDVRYTFGTVLRSINEIGVNNNHSIVLLVYKNGDIGYVNTFNRDDIVESGKLHFRTIKANELDKDFFNELLLEDRITA